MWNTVQITASKLVWRTATVSLIGMVSTIIESVALEVLSNALSVGALELVGRAKAHHFIRVVTAIIDAVASDVLRVAETVCTFE
jgi:hypothetical protein